ncbi:MAG: MMPL family transporter, partial [Thiotrichaceae bacterium]|nr:MMPL family transporter [Thiotrichaceae bacterium]
TSAISIALTMSFMAFLDVPVNILTSIIPALLIIIGSTEDVHLLTEYHSGIQRGLDRDLSILNLPKTQSVAISLAFITTFVGFISITVNDLEILTQFGWVVSMGLLINFVVTILFIPAYLKLFGGKQFKKSKSINLYQSFAKTIFLFVIRHKRATLIVSLLITIFFIGGIQSLQMNNNTLSYFSEDSEIQIRSRLVHDNLSGIQTFSIILDSGIEGTFLKVRYLEDVRKLQNFLDQRKVFDKSFSFADFIMLVNKVMDGEPKPSMPEEDELIDVYMSFISYDSVKSYVSHDFSNTRIVVRHNIESSQKLDEELHTIRVFIDEKLQTNLTVQFTGEAVLTNRASDSMASGQVKSLLLMVFVIFVLVSLLYV